MDEEKNTPEEKKPEELTFAERLGVKPVCRPCVCGKSKKYPCCDGSHANRD